MNYTNHLINFQFLLENSFVGLHLVNSEGSIEFITPHIEHLLGYSPEELIGKKVWYFVHKDDRKSLLKSIKYISQNYRKCSELEVRLISKNGDIKYVYNKFYNFINADGTGYIATYFQDVTERKETEDFFEQTRLYLETVLNNTQYGYFLLTNNRKILYYNQTAYNLILQGVDEYLRVGDDFLDYVSVQNKPHFLNIFDQVLKGKKMNYERHIIMPNHEDRWLDIWVVPVQITSQGIYAVAITLTDVTERKRNELKIINSQKTLQAIFNNSSQIAFLIDKNYKIMALNKHAIKETKIEWGREAKEGDSFLDFINESEKEEVKQRIIYCLEGNHIRLERNVKFLGTNSKWFEIFYAPIENAENEYFAVNIAMFDISERKKAEERLRYSEKLYQTIAENFPKANVNLFDKNFRLLFTQGQLYQHMDLARENFLHKTVYEIFSQRTNEVLVKNMLEAFKGYTNVFEHTNKLGIFLVTTVPIKNEDKNEIEYILVIFQDISDIKEKEQKLKQLNKELDEQNKFLKLKEEEILASNEELTISNEQLIKQQEILEEINHTLSQQQEILEDFNLQLTSKNETLSQREKELEEAYSKILEQQESMQASLIQQQLLNQELISKNIELASQEEELRSVNQQIRLQQEEMKITLAQLSDRNFELDQLVYRTSHDIRSPLTSVLGLINVMRLEGMPDNLVEYVNRMEKSIQKLDKFVSSMLSFAKVNRTERKNELINFEEIVQKCYEDFRFMPNFERIEKKLDINNPKKLNFYCDILRLEIIFANIISNAIKYQDVKKEHSFLKIAIHFQNTFLQIQFEDNGIGIKEEYIKKIFDMFFRATEKAEGSGLGLYIVKQTIEKLGGNIEVQSQYGEGTSLKIKLPYT
jgi:PAS domain S-box-containing protein